MLSMEFSQFSDEIPAENHETDLTGLTIENCPSIAESLKIIESNSFPRNIFAIVAKVNADFTPPSSEKIEEFSNKFKDNEILLISFTSTFDQLSYIYWKHKGGDKFLSVCSFTDIQDENPVHEKFVHKFLLNTIKCGYSGLRACIEPSKLGAISIELEFLSNQNDQDLLMVASENGNSLAVDYFILLHFDVNRTTNNDESAASLALKANNEEILLQLLKANSMYPKGIQKSSLRNEKLREFIEDAEQVHAIINKRKTNRNESVEEFHDKIIAELKENFEQLDYHLDFFYNIENVSAPAAALLKNRRKVYKFLLENDLNMGLNWSFEKIYKSICSSKTKEELQEMQLDHLISLDNQYLLILNSRSFIGYDTKKIKHKLRHHITEAFDILDSIPCVRKILKIVAASNDFQIIFEFNRDYVDHLDPKSNNGTKGIFHYDFSNKIYMSAKDFLDPQYEKRFAAIGTLAHELCHFAMFLIFRNHCYPYAFGDIDKEKQFDEILQSCMNKLAALPRPHTYEVFECVSIVQNVFDFYEKIDFHRELIVRVPHMIAHHYENLLKLRECREFFYDLFQYHDEILSQKFDSALEFIGIFAHKSSKIQWKILTSEMRMKVKNSHVKFQGFKIIFKEIFINTESSIFFISNETDIFGNTVEYGNSIYESLTSEQLIDILNDKIVNIGNELERDSNIYVERKLRGAEEKNFESLLEDIEKFSVLILADFPGAGKTTTFQNFALKLKEKYPFQWVCYIDLKKHVGVFKKFTNSDDLNVLEVLLEIFKINPNDFICKLLLSFYQTDRITIFWDGVDEISPNFFEFISKLFLTIKRTTYWKQWISTRFQCAKQLSDLFGGIRYYRHVQYSEEDQKNFIKQFIHKEVSNNEHKLEILRKNMIQMYNNTGKVFLFDAIDNPLILRMYCELTVSEDINFDGEIFYTVYERFIRKKLKRIRTKGDISEDDRDKALEQRKITIMEVHQIFAIKRLMTSKFRNIMTNEQLDVELIELVRMKIPFTDDEISRYEIVYVLLPGLYLFVHETFAEYFVAQYLIDNIYEEEKEVSEQEARIRLLLLFHVIFGDELLDKYDVIRDFLKNYLNMRLQKDENFLIQKSFRKLLMNEFRDILKIIYKLDNPHPRKLLDFLDFDKELINALLYVNESETFIYWLLRTNPKKWCSTIVDLRKSLSKILNDNDSKNLFSGNHQKGCVLYQIWKNSDMYIRNIISRETNIEYDEEKLSACRTFKQFLKYVKTLLTPQEYRELCRIHSHSGKKSVRKVH